MRALFHALPRSVARETEREESYAPDSLAREGFVHCSFRGTLLASVRAHMAGDVAIDVLQIDPRRLAAPVIVAETPRGPMPHVHGPIPRDAILASFSLEEFAQLEPTLPDRVTGTRFGFLAFEGMTLLDLVGAYDPISRVASMGFDPSARCEVFLAHDGEGANRGWARAWAQCGAELLTERVRPPLAEFDVLVVPGGSGTRALERDPSLAAWLASFPPNRLLTSVCTGALLLGAAGRLRGKRATTHHTALAELAAYGATVVHERVVDEGQLVTAAGVTSAIDLGLAVVRRLEGDDVAEKIAVQMEWPR